MEKPSPGFFARLVAAANVAPPAIAYVGDRLDNDLRPAAEAGLCTVFVRRGPWGYILYERGSAELELGSLDELLIGLQTLPTD